MTKALALTLILLAGSALGCSTIGSLIATPTVEGVLFQDDFSDPDSGWDRVRASTGLTDYADGVYRIFVDEPNTDYWANPGLDFTDVRVEVEATKVGGPDDNDLGLICRYQDTRNFYYGVISSDGFAGIIKVMGGSQSVISGENLEAVQEIHQGDATNTIRFDCVGEGLTLRVNGTQILSAVDAEWSNGDVGLVAGTYDTPGTDIHFDDFVVRTP
jgi:hypothetical protein